MTIQAHPEALNQKFTQAMHQLSGLKLRSKGPMQVLLVLLLLLVLLWCSAGAAPPSGYRSMLTHVDSHGGFTKTELMHRAALRSLHRASTMLPLYSTLSTSSDYSPTRLHSVQAAYLMELAIGTPPVPFIALADTGSVVSWTQCKPCKLCFPQDTPIYDPATSSSFSPVPCTSATCGGTGAVWGHNCTATSPCTYHITYADSAYSVGVLGMETITFGTSPGVPGVSVSGIAFGCGVDNGGDSVNSTGTVGLGRGSLSLVAQLGVGKFSYCLTDFFNSSLGSPMLFGSLAELASPSANATAIQSTPLVQSQHYPWLYVVSLEGISLGDALLPTPNGTLEVGADGYGGMIVDSGTTFTVLNEQAFRVVVDHVADVLGQPVVNASSLDPPCFPAPAGEQEVPPMPDMVLHFAGGANMTLHRDNYMYFDPDSSLFCLAIAGARSYGSLLGNFQMQNIHMLFDITVGQLSFVPTDCSKL